MVTKSPWPNHKETPGNKALDVIRILTDLARSLQQEEDAISDYTSRANDARNAGDLKTVSVYEHIIAEEKEHAREFSKRLREIGTE
jgi:rubrerythrin